MLEACRWQEFIDTFMGPPTPEEFAEWQQAELEYIDHRMLLNAR